jgi:hypothetical protein
MLIVKGLVLSGDRAGQTGGGGHECLQSHNADYPFPGGVQGRTGQTETSNVKIQTSKKPQTPGTNNVSGHGKAVRAKIARCVLTYIGF